MQELLTPPVGARVGGCQKWWYTIDRSSCAYSVCICQAERKTWRS